MDFDARGVVVGVVEAVCCADGYGEGGCEGGEAEQEESL